MANFRFYNTVHPDLKLYINHYWITTQDESDRVDRILLPMNHVDIIIPLAGGFTYTYDDHSITYNDIHFHGIRTKPVKIASAKAITTMGISFTPWGFFPIANTLLKNYTNSVNVLNEVAPTLAKNLSDMVVSGPFTIEKSMITTMEKCLLTYFQPKINDARNIELIKRYISNQQFDSSKLTSDKINPRRLQRLFAKYVGVSPKKYLDICKFEDVSRDILADEKIKLTDLCYLHDYYDQPHFNKAFSNYTGFTPGNFIAKEPALKKHLKYE